MTRHPAEEISYLLLRVVAALLFIQVGGLKLFGWFGGMPPGGGAAPFMTEAWFGGVLEVFGGAAIMLGLFTRPVAFILAGEMAVAYFQQHFPKSFFPTVNGGIPAILFCFIFLYLVFAGAGPWSIDAMVARAKFGDRAAIAGIAPRYAERRRRDAAA
jgi:putative oxidoreductase